MAIRTKSWLQTQIGRDLVNGKKKVGELVYSTYQYLRDLIDSFLAVDANNNITVNQITTTGDEPLTMNNTVWDDLRAPFSQTRQGALLKPDFDTTNVGLLFPQNDDTEITYIIMQLPHKYKLGTNIHPHIHWQQMNGNTVVWKFDYKWFDVGEAVPGAFTTVTANAQAFTWAAGNLHQIDMFPAISGAGIGSVSSILLLKVYRDDNVDAGAGGGDALAFEFDIHYEIDTLGSQSEFVK